MGPPQISIVGATPDSKVGDLPQQHCALLAPPGSTPMRESRNKAGRKSSRTARKDSPPSQPSHQALPIRQTPSQLQSQSQAPIPPMYAPSSSSPLAMEVENDEFSPPPLPIPPPRGIEDSPSQGLETRMDEIMPAGAPGDEGDEETWDPNSTSTLSPSSVPPTSRSHRQSGEIGNNGMVPQILVTSPEMDAQPKPPAMPSATERTGFNSGQGGTRGAYRQPFVTSAAKGRYKASVEDDPDSPGNAFYD